MKTIHPNELHGKFTLTLIAEDGEQHHIGAIRAYGDCAGWEGPASQAWTDWVGEMAKALYEELDYAQTNNQ